MSDAVFSGDYRYALKRTWDESLPNLMYIGLNPSIADATIDDPTVKKCIAYAKHLGFGRISIGNLFAYICTEPAGMKEAKDPIGPENNEWLKRLANDSKLIIAMWGNHGKFMDRDKKVIELGLELYCLKTTQKQQPHHILYLPYGLKPEKYQPKHFPNQ